MRNRLLATVALACISSSALADASSGERWPRWYLGIAGGVSFLDDSDLSGANTGEVKYDTGWSGAVALGYRPHFDGGALDSLRFELEGGYRSHNLDKGTVNAAPVNFSEDLRMLTFMGNVYYDFRNASRWTPYVGAGAGYAHVSLDNDAALANTDDSDSTWAWQLMAGLSYSPESIPLTEWSLGYRFFALDDPEFARATGPFELEDVMSHNVEVGARFRF
jgi:opacity protein-like surface antigen